MKRPSGKRQPSKKKQHLIAQLRRKSGTMELRKRFLVVCEDTKSAPNYFDSLRKHLRVSVQSLTVRDSDGRTQPRQVVTEAKETARKARQDGDAYDEVWAVVDLDDFGVDALCQARKQASDSNVRIAVSNPCYEYWVLLHFDDCRSNQLTRHEALRLVCGKWPSYSKGKSSFDDVVMQHRDATSRAASGLAEATRLGRQAEEHTPCTEVHLLVQNVAAARQ